MESAKTNYARVLWYVSFVPFYLVTTVLVYCVTTEYMFCSALKKYDEGLEMYKSLKKLSFEDYCQMGVAFYKQDNYSDSKYGMYEHYSVTILVA